MSISPEEVRHVAMLARLKLDDEQVAALQGELSAILDAVGTIQELDLADVPPTAHAQAVTNVTREDEERPCLTQEQALANAPRAEEGAFVVPKVVGAEDAS
jgi:aspartyl-tRNA(Asn)/glutamyl-tRNA(Gln) amidotransferase subunit C